MIVEDSMTQARALAAYLSEEIDVVIAVDGTQALRLVAVEHPDLIILDVNLPKLNGLQVCRRLKRDPNTAHIPIVMLSVAASEDQIKEGIEAGADGYIRKGENATEELLKTIRAYKLIDSIAAS
jgi:DNA-binding response OmpR family regulator